MDDRDFDKKYLLIPDKGIRGKKVSLDQVKSDFIALGLSPAEIANKYKLSVPKIEDLIKSHKLVELRKAYIQQGIQKIQNIQLTQAKKLLDLENGYKSLRITQLEDSLEEYLAYFARFGDLKVRDPLTGDILYNDLGIALTIKIPNIAKEVRDLKESVTVGEGLNQLLNKIDLMMNAGEIVKDDENPDIIDISDYTTLFDKRDE